MLNYYRASFWLFVTNHHSDLPMKHVIFPITLSWITRGHFPVKPIQMVVIHSQQEVPGVGHVTHEFICDLLEKIWMRLEIGYTPKFMGWSYLMLTNPAMTIGLSDCDHHFPKSSPLLFGWCIHFRSTPWVFPPCFRSAPGALQRLWWAERGNVHCNGALIRLTCLEPIRRCPTMWLCTPESSILLDFSIINHPAIGVHLWSYQDLRFRCANHPRFVCQTWGSSSRYSWDSQSQ